MVSISQIVIKYAVIDGTRFLNWFGCFPEDRELLYNNNNNNNNKTNIYTECTLQQVKNCCYQCVSCAIGIVIAGFDVGLQNLTDQIQS